MSVIYVCNTCLLYMSLYTCLLWVSLYMSVMGLSIHVCYGSVYTCMSLKIKGYSHKNKGRRCRRTSDDTVSSEKSSQPRSNHKIITNHHKSLQKFSKTSKTTRVPPSLLFSHTWKSSYFPIHRYTLAKVKYQKVFKAYPFILGNSF